MPEIILEETDRVDWALKVFRRKMMTARILQEVRRRRHYVKPGAARLLKSKAAKRMRDKARRRRNNGNS